MVSTPHSEPEVICVDQPSSGQKRSRTDTETADHFDPPTTPKLVILHFDAILDGRDAVIITVLKTFAQLQPTTPPPSPSRILSVFASSDPLLANKFKALIPPPFLTDANAASLRNWTDAYLETYEREGKALLAPFPGAKPFLAALVARRIVIAITTNHREFTKNFMTAHGMADLPDFIVRRAAGFAARPEVFREFFQSTLIPSYAAKRGRYAAGEEVEPLRPEEVLIVSCAPFNLRTAHAVGARACWVKMAGVELEGEEEGDVDADTIVVGDLAELGERIFGGSRGEEDNGDLKAPGNEVEVEMVGEEMGEEQQGIGGELEVGQVGVGVGQVEVEQVEVEQIEVEQVDVEMAETDL
ncbi:hypothetical protein B0T19DRAFT_443529 [Cercophora scortea]|uniref:Uncharacterized protein n=1 Tax=Cercophora scortea TaxID=314031 RepID=A0AAE0IFQ5_9PEZI|nr:hypothetical protein B0T19DRAFT_443529 [Cercophora scortea]